MRRLYAEGGLVLPGGDPIIGRRVRHRSSSGVEREGVVVSSHPVHGYEVRWHACRGPHTSGPCASYSSMMFLSELEVLS